MDAVTISVADTGIGIPVDEQPRVFERFFRSSNAQELAVPGTGLGLVIVKGIVDLHGGPSPWSPRRASGRRSRSIGTRHTSGSTRHTSGGTDMTDLPLKPGGGSADEVSKTRNGPSRAGSALQETAAGVDTYWE